MRKELDYFKIEESIGGNQSWFRRSMMYHGGCAAATACDVCIYLALYRGRTRLYPFDCHSLNREDYVRFSDRMEPYLRPRLQGINRLDIYIKGFSRYLTDRGEKRLYMDCVPGQDSPEAAREAARDRIDQGMVIPFLLLRHQDSSFKDYVWHWFLLTGYEERGNAFLVKTVTYGRERWMSLEELWDTGYRKKGGMILLRDLNK